MEIGLRNLHVVAENLVEANLQRSDAGPFALALFHRGDDLFAVLAEVAELVKFAMVTAANHPRLGGERGRLVGDGAFEALANIGKFVKLTVKLTEQRAAAYVAGATPHELADLPGLAPRLDLLFSTVPTRVVGEDVLARLPKSALVVDLAAPPGGVDFDAAKRLGINAIWGRGLGSRAPVTVGASQWGGIRARIEKILQDDP